MKFTTLRSRLILGFALVTVPLVILLLWNNLYATQVVHSQVALSNKNLLTIYMNDMDKVLEEIENYLYKSAEQDQGLISLSQYEKDSWEYYLSQTQTVNNLYTNTNYYTAVDCLFAYSSKYNELFLAPQYSVNYDRKQSIQSKLQQLLQDHAGNDAFFNDWTLVEEGGEYALVRIVDTNYSSYIGAWVDLNHLMQPLDVLSREGKGEALLLSGQGETIANLNPAAGQTYTPQQWMSYLEQGMSSYNIVQLQEPYLLVAQQSRMAQMYLLLLLPEKSLLEGLPFFRNLTYMVPLLALAMLIVYLIFLQQSIVQPIHNLIRGMRKIRAGNLSARLEENNLVEFITINEAFNGMATQIEHLKINIYEEQIRTQKAELKHLQAQIHPHFFMNSLNIVYHLAQIRNFDVIQSMALHLVRYFRYTTRTHLSTITLQEEVEHVGNYLTIQRFRFPETLDFGLDIDPLLNSCEVPPLIIQPLVENAVIHGFSLSSGPVFRIRVTAYEMQKGEEKLLCVEVKDNGKGLSPEQIGNLRRRVNSIEPEDGHIGLWNIMRRCRLYYKSDIQMEFAGSQPGRTVIYAVKGLLAGVRWEHIGVTAVFEAYHSAMARQVLGEQEIDIMICDIEMPEGSGLELMEWMNGEGYAPETVMLTCHAEFSYAQRALQLGGYDYLLKPVLYEDLENVLLRAISRVEAKRKVSQTDELYRKYEERWNKQKPLLIERFWQDLLEQRILPERPALESALASYDMGVEMLEQVRLILISVENWEKPFSDRDEEIMEFALCNAAEEMILQGRKGNVIRDSRGNLLTILYLGGEGGGPGDEDLALQESCAGYIEVCNSFFYCKLSCYVGECAPISGIMRLYHTLLHAEYENVTRSSEVILPHAAGALPAVSVSGQAISLIDWSDCIEQGNNGELSMRLNELMSELGRERITAETLASLYHAFLQAVYYVLHRRGLSAHLLYAASGVPADSAAATRSVPGFKNWVKEMALAVTGLLASQNGTNAVVQKIKTYISERLHEELTREQIAALVFLNPAYLSRLFRKETGMALTDYILQERMRKAAEQLVITDKSISEIADGLGYANFSYFARLFRKVYAVTPHDYRKNLRSRI
ncbi:hypothetical protein KC345_g9774 [Hortaea werneckii]|nr:hypothetical protein KC345_g9774 [Hortaea werneckii]